MTDDTSRTEAGAERERSAADDEVMKAESEERRPEVMKARTEKLGKELMKGGPPRRRA
jgi:hypothetical protein